MNMEVLKCLESTSMLLYRQIDPEHVLELSGRTEAKNESLDLGNKQWKPFPEFFQTFICSSAVLYNLLISF